MKKITKKKYYKKLQVFNFPNFMVHPLNCESYLKNVATCTTASQGNWFTLKKFGGPNKMCFFISNSRVPRMEKNPMKNLFSN